ncbi:acylphosphatase [candidate division WWE3 bacterium]|uniref:acylphosphatase n=1 Tax=candidate division WWE3 bacterium TaxID=2053526 RepID=A0A955LJB2_UNCKA|nr:acylphosphatase [candidate division WWE3 bacterium]
MTKHVNIILEGMVQGVFFRESTLDKARELSIAGFILNQPDGSVFIEAEGDESSVATFVDWCKQGPPQANVQKCTTTDAEIKGFSEFEIHSV